MTIPPRENCPNCGKPSTAYMDTEYYWHFRCRCQKQWKSEKEK